MNIDIILKDNEIVFERNVSLKKKTWLKTGGVVSYWIEPDTIEKTVILAKYLDEAHLRYEVIGHTSNIFYVDDYNPDIIISTSRLNRYSINDDNIFAECGVPVTKLSRECAERGIKGFGGMVGLPGTVGAAACNNSSCFDCSISALLIEADFYNSKTREIETMQYEDFHYSKRFSILKGNGGGKSGILLSVKLRLTQGSKEEELKQIEFAQIYRKSHHEKPAYTLGSVFAERKLRKDLKYYIFSCGVAVMRILRIENRRRVKDWRLYLYGYRDIQDFVSKMNVNTFIWQKEESSKYEKFMRYVEFMNRIYKHPKLEIEIRK